jgi:hypothetical protein
MRNLVMVALTAAALSACNKPAPQSAAATGAQAPAPGGAAGGPPHRRAGLWQTSVTVDGHTSPMGAMKLCVDEAMGAKTQAFQPSGPASLAAQKTHCAYPPPTRGADGAYSVTFTCPISGGGQTVTKANGSGDWSSAYKVHIESDTTGAPIAAANGHHVTDMDSQWLGPCPEGMAGGDMQLPGGMRVSGSRAAGAAKMLRGMTGSPSSGGQ